MVTTIKQSVSFPEVATIRKGGAKVDKTRSDGSKYQSVGADLQDKFRVVFEPGTDDLAKAFLAEYGSYEVSAIRAMLPFPKVLESWRSYNEAYANGRMVAQADNDHYLMIRNPRTGEYLVKDGEPFTPFVPGKPFEYKGKDDKPMSLPVKPHSSLKLFLPYTIKMNSVRLVHFTLKTSSFYDSQNILNNLAAIQSVADTLNNGNAAGIPIILYRRLTDILWNHTDGTASREKKWLVYVEVSPEWTADAMRRFASLASGGSSTYMLPAPQTQPAVINAGRNDPNPADDTDEEEDHSDAVDIVSVETPAPIREETVSAPVTPLVRPYAPEVVREKLAATVEKMGAKTVKRDDRVLVMQMAYTCMVGAGLTNDEMQERSRAVLRWLSGYTDPLEMPGAWISALLNGWLKPDKDSGGAISPCSFAVTEAKAIYAQVVADGLDIPF